MPNIDYKYYNGFKILPTTKVKALLMVNEKVRLSIWFSKDPISFNEKFCVKFLFSVN